MRTKKIKLLILMMIGLAFAACARQAPLELPPPMISDDPSSGWKNY